ncbi:protein LURP-one-related 15-like [Impatiens glandulifera]|uniref:protein LURP-one-related 15-like n=1 Tax=Impatiens glandulifera TaxID=253017 RepID=UPI001FB13FFD|nr:protein LURP-one-related 15-like [Impatiens glandulifera]
MASISSSGQISVVNSEFCLAYPVDIIIKKKLFSLSKKKYAVTNADGDLFLNVTENFFGVHRRRYLSDTDGNTFLTLQECIMTMHSRWEVFMGDSTEDNNLLFSVKSHSMFQSNTEYDVFMATNSEESGCCDFKIYENEIYAGNTKNNLIAQMNDQGSFMNTEYLVNVYPNVDLVFIVALVVIFEEIKHGGTSNSEGIFELANIVLS